MVTAGEGHVFSSVGDAAASQVAIMPSEEFPSSPDDGRQQRLQNSIDRWGADWQQLTASGCAEEAQELLVELVDRLTGGADDLGGRLFATRMNTAPKVAPLGLLSLSGDVISSYFVQGCMECCM
jgi:hypothetical protein